MSRLIGQASLVVFLLFAGCADDDENGGNTEADKVGVGAACAVETDCPEYEPMDGGTTGGPEQLQCLTQFTGGYCGLLGCSNAEDCPTGSTCVAHTDGSNYCFRECVDKSECNANRPAEAEANCSANFDYADPTDSQNGVKACIPPSSGS